MTHYSASPGKLGLSDCIMLLVGAMIGSAIFSLSGLTIFMAGPAAVLSWMLSGFIMLGYGLCMAELACRYPKSGGVYVFPALAFGGRIGRWLGWLSCWCFILTNIVAIAFSGIYVGIYLSVAFPWAAHLQFVLALSSVTLSMLLNLLRIKVAGRFNALLVAVLLITMAIFMVAAFRSGSYDVKLLTPFFTQGVAGPTGWLAAVPTAIIGYSGIVALAFMAGEVHHANRTLPWAMLMAIGGVILVYTLMIFATLGLIPAAYLAEHPEMRFIPMFAACFTKLSGIPQLTAVVSIAAVLALLTTMNVCVSINARALEAAGAAGILPGFLARRSAANVPVWAVAVTGIAAMIYCCFPEYTQEIVNLGAVFNILTMVITMLALIRARRSAAEGVFRVPGGRAVPYLVLGILLAVDAAGLFAGGWRLWLYTAGFLMLGALLGIAGGKSGRRNGTPRF